jgi:hypothetical protein
VGFGDELYFFGYILSFSEAPFFTLKFFAKLNICAYHEMLIADSSNKAFTKLFLTYCCFEVVIFFKTKS